MANLIIKSSADNLVLQGSDASPAITVGATGTTTFAENATLSGTGNSIASLGTVASGTLGSAVINNSGRYFKAWRSNSSNQLVSTGTFTLCTFDNVLQSHSSFSDANDYFTAVADDVGNWFFAVQMSMYVNAGDMNNPAANIYHNDANVLGGYKLIFSSTQTVRHFTVNTTGLLTIASGDTIKLYGHVNGTSPYFFGGDTISVKGTSIVGVKL